MLENWFEKNIFWTKVDPRINLCTCDNAFTPSECDHLMKLAKHRMIASEVVDAETGKNKTEESSRNSWQGWLEFEENKIVKRLEKRLSSSINVSPRFSECFQILRYQPGQYYRPHFDFFADTPGNQYTLSNFGQRIASMCIFLNDNFEGGNTSFPRLGVSITPKKGRAILFLNVEGDRLLEDALHGGDEVTQGEKWMATKWFRQKLFN